MSLPDASQQRGAVAPDRAAAGEEIALVDLLDRLLGSGVVLSGDIVISVAGIDLVQVQLRALLSSVRADMRGGDDGAR